MTHKIPSTSELIIGESLKQIYFVVRKKLDKLDFGQTFKQQSIDKSLTVVGA